MTANNGANDSSGQRRMVGATDSAAVIAYDLYSDSAHATTFPTAVGTLGAGNTGGTGNGTSQSVTVYGRIPAGQTLPAPDNYADTVQLTVNY